MESLENLKVLYKKSKENDELISTKPRVWEYKNVPIREDLLKRADALLPEEKRLAIILYKSNSKKRESEIYGWNDEINELERDWDSFYHKKYLNKAIELLKLSNFENLVEIIKIIE